MSEALYERYKDALRRGHVAAVRSRHAQALDAYSEAARIAPDRALPLVGIAGVLTRLGKRQEALATYDAALDRAPADEAALRGRAELLASSGDRAGAAETYDRLAAALDAAERVPDGLDAARQALELAESRGRRATVRSFAERLRGSTDDPTALEALARAETILEAGEGSGTGRRASASEGPQTEADEPAGVLAAVEDTEAKAAPESEPDPPFDPVRAIGDVEEAALRDDPAATRALALAAVPGHRDAGQPSTAIDACYMALAGSPADPGLHLALVELYLDQGWRGLAADKLVLLARLAELTDDPGTTDRVRVLVRERLPDDPRVALLVA